MMQAISNFIYYQILGWKVNGAFPNLDKFVVIVAPHTSNWDFLLGILSRRVTHLRDAKFLGKSQLFKPPFGWLFRWMGGYPVDRTKNNNLVDAVVEIFDREPKFKLALAPEGTRKRVEKFKSGFYVIATKAKVPILMVGFDYSRKEIRISAPFYPSDSMEEDLKRIMDWYGDVRGKNLENEVQ